MSNKQPPKQRIISQQQVLIMVEGLEKLSRSEGVTWGEVNPLMQMLMSLPELSLGLPQETDDEKQPGTPGKTAEGVKANGSA